MDGSKKAVLGTADSACLRVDDPIAGWGCSNFDGRMVKVNRMTVMCGDVPLPDPIDGAYYFDISAGNFNYAAIYWY